MFLLQHLVHERQCHLYDRGRILVPKSHQPPFYADMDVVAEYWTLLGGRRVNSPISVLERLLQVLAHLSNGSIAQSKG